MTTVHPSRGVGTFVFPKAANVAKAGACRLFLFLQVGMWAAVMSFVAIPVTGQVGAESGLMPESFPQSVDQPKIELAHDQESLTRYEQELDGSFAELDVQLTMASVPALEAFDNYFIRCPSSTKLRGFRRALKDKLAVFRAKRPPAEEKGEAARALYAAQVRVVTGILKAATIRLASIDKLAAFTKTSAVEVQVNNMPPSTQMEEQDSGVVGFSSLVEALGNRPVPPEKSTGKGIPKLLVRNLANAVLSSDMSIDYDKQVLGVLREHLSGIGTTLSIEEQAAEFEILAKQELLPMPEGVKPFPLALFKTVLNGFGQFHDDFYISADVIESWARLWTVEGALSYLRELEHREKTRREVLLGAKDDIVNDWVAMDPGPLGGTDLFTLGVFLL